jgi:hypothetical protein
LPPWAQDNEKIANMLIISDLKEKLAISFFVCAANISKKIQTFAHFSEKFWKIIQTFVPLPPK